MLPNSVTVLGFKFKIVTKLPRKLPEATAREINLEGLYGCFLPNEGIIYINKSLNDEQQLRTLLHELTHAIVHRSGLRFTLSWSEDLEEILCEAMANTIYEILTKDGKFVECFIP